jgi:hypothetical protein
MTKAKKKIAPTLLASPTAKYERAVHSTARKIKKGCPTKA